MKKKPNSIIILMMTVFSSVLFCFYFNVNSTGNFQISMPFSNNKSVILKERTFNSIIKDEANGTRPPLNVIQMTDANGIKTDFEAINNKGSGSTGVTSITNSSIIEVPTDYNTSFLSLKVGNLTAQPTWKDVENDIPSPDQFRDYANDGTVVTGGQSFYIPNRSRILNISIYANVVQVNANDNYSVEIWDSSGTGGLPGNMIASRNITGTVSYIAQWHDYSFNLNLTAGSYYFIINATYIPAGLTGSAVNWRYLNDAFPPPTDSNNESRAVGYFGGSWIDDNIDYSMKVQTILIDNLNNTQNETSFLTPESLKLNATIDNIQKIIPDQNKTVIFSGINLANDLPVILNSTISSFSCNLTWNITHFNRNKTTLTEYNTSISSDKINWQFNYIVSFPDKPWQYYNLSIEKPSSSWDLVLVLNSTDMNVTNGILEDNDKIYLSNDTDNILTSGEWQFVCQNSIPSLIISMNQSNEVLLYDPQAFVHNEGIEVNVTVPNFSNGIVNLTIYNSTDDVTSEWTGINSSILNNYALLNITVPPKSKIGNYTVQAVWSNNTHAGINQTYILVVNATKLVVINENEVAGEQIIGKDINLTVFYNDTHSNVPINNTVITFELFNQSDSIVYSSDILEESMTVGYYNYSIPTASFVNGSYQLRINASKEWYNNQSILRNFVLVYNTSLERISPNIIQVDSLYPENLSIAVNYSSIIPLIPITDSNVTFITNQTTPEGFFNGTLVWDSSSETYNVTLNSSDFLVNNIYEINITATKLGSKTRQLTIYWNLTIAPTELILYWNNTSYNYEDYMTLTAFYNDTGQNVGIVSGLGTVNVTCVWNDTMLMMIPSTPNGNYSITFDTRLIGAGNYDFIVNAVKPKYQYAEANIINHPINKYPSTQVVLNETGVKHVIWGNYFYVNVSYQRSDNSPITEIGNAYTNWIVPGYNEYLSFVSGSYIFNISLNDTNNGPFTHAGLWGINFTVNNTNYADAWADLTVNITSLSHLNATDQLYNDYNATSTYRGEDAVISILYKDLIFDDPLNDLDNYNIMTNWTNGWQNVSKGNGFYDVLLNTTGMPLGNYRAIINTSHPYYEFQEIICNVTIMPKFNVTIVLLTTIAPSYAPGDAINFTVRILNSSDGTPVSGEEVTFLKNLLLLGKVLTDGNGYATYIYTVEGGDAGKSLDFTILFNETYEYHSNMTILSTKIEEELLEVLQLLLIGAAMAPKGIDPRILYFVIATSIIAVVLVGTYKGVGRRRRRIEKEKQEILSPVSDVASIERILTIDKDTGIDIYNYGVKKGMDPSLVSGFIQAVKSFGQELSEKAQKEKKKKEEI